MRVFASAFLLPLALASPLASLNSSEESALAPLSGNGEHIDDAYIVVFKKDVTLNQISLHLGGVEEWHGSTVSIIPSTDP